RSCVLACAYFASFVLAFIAFVILIVMNLLFFFSSRRRHTRCYRDWSSDVCSSDLGRRICRISQRRRSARRSGSSTSQLRSEGAEIGRASCRERVWSAVGGVAGERKEGDDNGEVQGVYARREITPQTREVELDSTSD